MKVKFLTKLQTGPLFICADSQFYAQGTKKVSQVHFILSIGLPVNEKVKYSSKMALQAGTPLILVEY
jgi:hypothetical protein